MQFQTEKSNKEERVFSLAMVWPEVPNSHFRLIYFHFICENLGKILTKWSGHTVPLFFLRLFLKVEPSAQKDKKLLMRNISNYVIQDCPQLLHSKTGNSNKENRVFSRAKV